MGTSFDQLIGLGSLAAAILVAIFSVARKPPFVATARLADLHATIESLQQALAVSRQELADLRTENRALERSRAFWQKSFEDQREGKN